LRRISIYDAVGEAASLGGGDLRSRPVVPFQASPFPVEIILLCARWYCKYGISYRDSAKMVSERGVEVDPSAIFRRVQCYAP
jgi:hypothetical protein